MDYKNLIVETIRARGQHPPLSHPALEPDVVQIAGIGSISVIIGADGRARLVAHSDRFRNDWGTASQRMWILDDPDDEAAVVDAISRAYDALL